MDQDEFRQTYKEVNECYCTFEKSVLTNQCCCSQSERFCIAEREGVHCLSEEAQQRCLHTLSLLRNHTRFALRTHEEKSMLPHGKAIRIQVGGMRGIRALVEEKIVREDNIDDINGTILDANSKYQRLENIPFSEVMPAIAAYKGRERKRRSKNK